MSKFSDGSSASFEELPVPVAYLKWSRGDAKLRAVAKDDPGIYLGGFRAAVLGFDKEELPSLPLPVVDRMSSDGKHPYKVYASNVINFLPLQHRTRFERKEKYKDEQGNQKEKVVAIARERREGYTPHRQVFGLIFSKTLEQYSPAVLNINSWSAFITFEQSGQKWNKIDKNVPDDEALIRRYGTLGNTIEENGEKVIIPNFETYGQAQSTPIEAIGLDKPRTIKVTPEIEKLHKDAEAWANCPRWNAEGKVEDGDEPIYINANLKAQFDEAADAIPLSNIDKEGMLRETNWDFKKALANLRPPENLADVNQAFEEAEDNNPFA